MKREDIETLVTIYIEELGNEETEIERIADLAMELDTDNETGIFIKVSAAFFRAISKILNENMDEIVNYVCDESL